MDIQIGAFKSVDSCGASVDGLVILNAS